MNRIPHPHPDYVCSNRLLLMLKKKKWWKRWNLANLCQKEICRRIGIRWPTPCLRKCKRAARCQCCWKKILTFDYFFSNIREVFICGIWSLIFNKSHFLWWNILKNCCFSGKKSFFNKNNCFNLWRSHFLHQNFKN